MNSRIFNLSKSQKILLYSAITAVLVRVLCLYLLTQDKTKFKINDCMSYILFSTLAYLYYYKIALP
jgi:hypothetical protein